MQPPIKAHPTFRDLSRGQKFFVVAFCAIFLMLLMNACSSGDEKGSTTVLPTPEKDVAIVDEKAKGAPGVPAEAPKETPAAMEPVKTAVATETPPTPAADDLSADKEKVQDFYNSLHAIMDEADAVIGAANASAAKGDAASAYSLYKNKAIPAAQNAVDKSLALKVPDLKNDENEDAFKDAKYKITLVYTAQKSGMKSMLSYLDDGKPSDLDDAKNGNARAQEYLMQAAIKLGAIVTQYKIELKK